MVAQDNNLTLNHSAVNGTDDREAHPKFWIAAYTRPRSEKKAATEIAKSGIDTFVPVQKQLSIWSDRKKYIDRVVIPLVIFIHVSEDDIPKLKKYSLILRLLTYPGMKQPAHIPDSQIDNLKKVIGSQSSIEFKPEKFTTSDRVVVVKGGLRGLVGEVKETVDDTTIVWISVDVLGGVEIKLKNSDLEHYTY